MDTKDVKIGMRVRVKPNNKTAQVVVSDPEYWNGAQTSSFHYEVRVLYSL